MSVAAARLASVVIGLSTALVIAAVAVLALLNPVWVAFEQERAQAAAWTGYAPADLRAATDAILADLVLGPPDFDVAVRGVPVLTEPERGHMRDVRTVFTGFFVLAAVAAAVLGVAFLRRGAGTAFWNRVRRGGLGLAVGTLVLGGLGVAFFDTAFTLFHDVLFPAGTWTFDPRTDRLVQLFPYQFWFETTAVLGGALVVLGLVTWRLAGRGGR